jgi:hypothetical protein
MTWNQGDQKAKNMLFSETKQRYRLTAVKANSAVWFRWKSLFFDFSSLEFYLHLPTRFAGECKSSDNYSLERTLRVAHLERYRNHPTSMHNAIKKYAPIVFLSTATVSGLNYFAYQAIIQIAQAQADTIPANLIFEIITTIAIHIIALSVLPLALSATNRTLTGYVVLIILAAIYITYMTGINVAGSAIATVAFCYLAFYGYSKAKGIYNYYRAK